MDPARANAKPDKRCLKAIMDPAKLSLTEAQLAVLQREPQARVLSRSPELLEQLPIPGQTKAFVRVLRDPGTGAVVYLIGTCHVSKASADDVQMLVEMFRPDMVAIELDKISFGMYLSGQLPWLAADQCPSTTRGILRFLWHPDYGSSLISTLWNAYYPIFESQCLGVPYPSDVLSALRSAENTPEVQRIQCMERSWYTNFLAETFSPGRGDSTNDTDQDDDSTASSRALGRMFRAFRQDRPLSRDELETFRAITVKETEKLRTDGVSGKPDVVEELAKAGVDMNALLHDLDRHMAGALADATAAGFSNKCVAVVGASHVPGILKRFSEKALSNHFAIVTKGRATWERELSARLEAEKQAEVAEFVAVLVKPAWSSRTQGVVVSTALTAARVGAYVLHKRSPQAASAATIVGGAAVLATGPVHVGLASLTATWVRFGAFLERAAGDQGQIKSFAD